MPVAVLVCGVALAHARATPVLASPMSDAPAKALEWAPSDITYVLHQGRSQVALLVYVRSALGKRTPACFDALEREAAHLYGLCRFPGDPDCVNAAYGFTNRAAVEQCATDTFRALTGRVVTLERQGRFTRASSGDGARYLAWSDDGWLYFAKNRARVEAMLKRPGAPTLAPALRSLLARVSLSDPLWTVFAGDFTTGFIGVRSTGFVQQNAVIPRSKGASTATRVPVTFLFRTEVEAQRAIGALARSAGNDAFSPPLRKALSALRPSRREREVDIDMAVFVEDPSAMEAAVAAMKQRVGAR
jgi:hypothetical protein